MVHSVYATQTAHGFRLSLDPPDAGDPLGQYFRIDLACGQSPRVPTHTMLTVEFGEWVNSLAAIILESVSDPHPAKVLPLPAGVKFQASVNRPARPPHTLLASAANTGTVPIENVTVFWQAHYDKPQPSPFPHLHGGGPIDGLGHKFLPLPEGRKSDIAVGEECLFFMPTHVLPDILSHFATLSPDAYRVEFRSGHNLLGRMPGSQFTRVLNDLQSITAAPGER